MAKKFERVVKWTEEGRIFFGITICICLICLSIWSLTVLVHKIMGLIMVLIMFLMFLGRMSSDKEYRKVYYVEVK